ncbi:uncharacterized protein BT62DRAFT_114141 [Guyanagaster necrorhizus]|uniref:SWIM-type domain-containing protein n=1 Tax=Guyanagaster necrorhizus TaxID=856835 RepID=A0A9P7VTE2_9AGAR|nr:uncharacterized protein BT62DRAFT_114141 [Guyanagaster necrorhizus MCA 3950]KAG7446350.1 hypothetical protein BT62DRAFT_114141 [Guyanagaster necrorhizus MCA 3950]
MFSVTDDALHRLQVVFPEPLILAALDIIDRENVVKYETISGHVYYEVAGSTGTHTVNIGLNLGPVSSFCTCPAYIYAVLLSKSHLMCKHLLAVRLAERIHACVRRPIGQEELAVTLQHRYTNVF